MATQRNDATVHLTMLKSLKKKLDQMAAADRRDRTEFLRLLIEDEWERRTVLTHEFRDGQRAEVSIKELYPHGADAPGVPSKGDR